jgi:hypothetical protein
MNKNGLSDAAIQAINDMVEGHLIIHGLIPSRMRPVTTVAFEPIYDAYSEENQGVLDADARKLFVEFLTEKAGDDSKKKRVYSKLRGFVSSNAKCFMPGYNYHERHIITVRHIVTYGINSRDGVDREWKRLQCVGIKGLAVIDEWLTSLNLRRGMRFQ